MSGVPTPLTDARVQIVQSELGSPDEYVSVEFARSMERILQLWGILHNTPPLITDKAEWEEFYKSTIELTNQFLTQK